MNFADRVKGIPSSASLYRSTWKGVEGIIDIGSGEIYWDTAEFVKDAAKAALDKGMTKYVPSIGFPELREALAEKLLKENGVDVDAKSEILVTNGSNEGIFLAMQAFLNPGDEVILHEPGYGGFVRAAMVASAKPVFLPLRKDEKGFRLDPQDFEKAITPRTKMMVFCSPDNPTAIAPSTHRDVVEAMAEIARKRNVLVLADELMEKFVYDGKEHFSIASLPAMKNMTVTIGGFSKAYAMTGWRVGYAYGDKALIEPMAKLLMASAINVAPFIQYAAAIALKEGKKWISETMRKCENNRNFLVSKLNRIDGIFCQKPEGSYLAFPDISALGLKSNDFARLMFDRHKTVVTSGSYLGEHGEGHIKLAYAMPIDELRMGLERIEALAEDIRGGIS